MTPFALYLEQLRRSRNLQQKQMAVRLGINPSYLSSLEKGRKSPPSLAVLNTLISSLKLSRHEQDELWRRVQLSELTPQLPLNMSQEEYELVFELRNQLGSLNSNQVLVLRKVLEMARQTNAMTM
jgi:HTH-type transcriptional regulator, competence development regulator